MTLYEQRLDYYKDKPTRNNDTVLGYLTLKNDAECNPYDKEIASFFSSSSQYCFTVSDGTVEVSFSASSDNDRIDWVEHIRAAINGVRHIRPITAASFEVATTEKPIISKRVSAAKEGMSTIVELPRKIGELQKKPIVGKYGFKSPKTRYCY